LQPFGLCLANARLFPKGRIVANMEAKNYEIRTALLIPAHPLSYFPSTFNNQALPYRLAAFPHCKAHTLLNWRARK